MRLPFASSKAKYRRYTYIHVTPSCACTHTNTQLNSYIRPTANMKMIPAQCALFSHPRVFTHRQHTHHLRTQENKQTHRADVCARFEIRTSRMPCEIYYTRVYNKTQRARCCWAARRRIQQVYTHWCWFFFMFKFTLPPTEIPFPDIPIARTPSRAVVPRIYLTLISIISNASTFEHVAVFLYIYTHTHNVGTSNICENGLKKKGLSSTLRRVYTGISVVYYIRGKCSFFCVCLVWKLHVKMTPKHSRSARS